MIFCMRFQRVTAFRFRLHHLRERGRVIDMRTFGDGPPEPKGVGRTAPERSRHADGAGVAGAITRMVSSEAIINWTQVATIVMLA